MIDSTWIEESVEGIIEYCNSNNIYEIYNSLDIGIVRVDENDFILKGNDALYIRNYFDKEVVFIRDDLPAPYERFALGHELGHALLHVEIVTAAYNMKLVNKGKLERQADYFALKLLNIDIDKETYDGYTFKQLASEFYVTEDSLKYCY